MAVTFSGRFIGSGRTIIGPAGGAVTTDPLWNQVSLLIRGDGSIVDSSTYAHAITVEGNTTVSTTAKWGDGSVYFDGLGGRITVPTSTALDLTGDFTIEMWVNPTQLTSVEVLLSISALGEVGPNMTELYVYPSGAIDWLVSGGIIAQTTTGVLPLNTWTHLAVTRLDDTHTIWVNGVSSASANIAVGPNTGYNWSFGDRVVGAASANYPLNGYLDDIRVTNGTARYVSNFTPPTGF